MKKGKILFRALLAVLFLTIGAIAVYTGYFLPKDHDALAVMSDSSLGQALGPAETDNVLVAIVDYQCGPCQELHPVLHTLQQNHPDLKIVIKYIPVNMASETTIRLALAAATLGAFPKMHDFLMENQPPFDNNALDQMFRELSLSEQKVTEAMYSDEVTTAMRDVYAAATRLGIFTLPAFIYNGTVYNKFERIPTLADFERLLALPSTTPQK